MLDPKAVPAADADLGAFLQGSSTAFDLCVGPADRFPSSTIHVDQPFLDGAVEGAFPKQLGALPIKAVDGALQKIALTCAHRLARAEADRLGVSVNGLRRAWFLPIWAEMVTLVPLRHLARKLHAAHPGAIFAIPVARTRFTAIAYWRPSEVEAIYLALELRRCGAKVCLRTDQLAKPEMRFTLSPLWRRKWQSQFRRDAGFTTVLCAKHMRRDEFVAAASGATRKLRPGPLARLGAARAGSSALNLALRKGPVIEGVQVFSAPRTVPTLSEAFSTLMSPPTLFLKGWVQRVLRNKPVSAAHIADHASLDGGLLAEEVLRKGGKLHLWPHSANAVDANVHTPEEIAHVTLAARSTAAVWAQRYGWDKVSVDLRTILPQFEQAPPFDATRPLHVVLFGGAHALHRLPMVALEEHKDTWRRTFSGLQASGVELTVKHKSGWETRDWIRALAEEGMELQFSRTHATKLAVPNMVFMSISLASTALLEGIARGIPAIIVRDQPIRETPHYDPDYVPCIPSDAVAETLTALNSQTAWEDLRRRQQEWFARETS